jgi:hypothetical protein
MPLIRPRVQVKSRIRISRCLLVPKVAFERMLAEAGQKPREPEAA